MSAAVRATLLVLHGCTCAFLVPAVAADDVTVGVSSYPSAFFVDAQPQTAFDMIARLPGFALDAGDEGVRGYAGSTGNVLIDGRRPASKYDSLENILKRIPASTVSRIDLVRGSSPGIDMQGQAQVANIVRLTDTADNARAEVGLYAHGDGRFLPEGRLEGSRQRNGRLLEGSLHAYEVADDESGTGYRQRTDAQGQLIQYGTSTFLAADRGVQGTAGYERPWSSGNLRFNVSLLAEKTDEDEDVHITVPGDSLASINERKDAREAEIGVHYNGIVGHDSELEILAIQQLRDSDKTESEYDDGDDAVFTEEYTKGESILRVAISNSLANGGSFEWGAEGAFNFLDSNTSSEENGIPVVLPAADVRVEERRVEAFGRYNRGIASSIELEIGAALEYSKISQSGDSSATNTLVYIKPRAMLTWTPSPSDQLRLRIQRDVGQLDFDDFVTSSEFSTGTVDVGNPELVPYTAWDVTASWERRFRTDSTVSIGFRHSRISDVVDIVPLYADTDDDGVLEIFEGTGNIGSGHLNEAQLGVTWPTDRLAIHGGIFRADVIYRHTSVIDPLTGETRSIIDYKQPWEGRIAFTQDLPQWRFRWGMHLRLAESEPEYRLDETRRETEESWVGMFAEFLPAPAWSVLIEAQNLSGRAVELTRTLYDAPRNAGAVEAVNEQSRSFDPYLFLRVRWQIR